MWRRRHIDTTTALTPAQIRGDVGWACVTGWKGGRWERKHRRWSDRWVRMRGGIYILYGIYGVRCYSISAACLFIWAQEQRLEKIFLAHNHRTTGEWPVRTWLAFLAFSMACISVLFVGYPAAPCKNLIRFFINGYRFIVYIFLFIYNFLVKCLLTVIRRL